MRSCERFDQPKTVFYGASRVVTGSLKVLWPRGLFDGRAGLVHIVHEVVLLLHELHLPRWVVVESAFLD